MRSKSVNSRWTEPEKVLMQNIFYRSQTTYKFLREKLTLNIPHIIFPHFI